MKEKKKSLIEWILFFAQKKKCVYGASMLLAAASVACGVLPYALIAKIVRQLLALERDFALFFRECAVIASFWAANVILHAVSTTISHAATFNVLANIRKSLCDKLARLPLGSVLDMPSGAQKYHR